MSTTKTKTSNLIEKLISSIKRREFNPNHVTNLTCFHDDKLIVWNEDDQCLWACSLDDDHQISNSEIIYLSCAPSFSVTTLTANPHGNYLALSGPNGVMVVELPLKWTIHSPESKDSSKILSRSYSIAERMFLCNSNSNLLCLRWHPVSKKHLFILNNDNYLRLFDIEDNYEPIETISLNFKDIHSKQFEKFSLLYSNSLGENCVAFDFGPSLSRYYSASIHQEKLCDIYPIFILKENGDVLLVYFSLQDLFIGDKIYGPLKMTPAAEDNYGSDACSILCLDCVPPILVIGTSSGILYHCVAMESEHEAIEFNTKHENQFEETYSVMTCSGFKLVIPEIILYVLETIELSFPLITNSLNSDCLNTSLQLFTDIKDPKRYFCVHSFGVHIVMVSFFKQLSSLEFNEFYDDQSIVEYLICTRPTVEKPDCEYEQKSFPVGVVLISNRGFTYVLVLLNSAELISKQLSNIVLKFDQTDALFAKKTDFDLENLLNGNNPNSSSGSTQVENKTTLKKFIFTDHLEKILVKNTNLPLIKSSKSKDATVGAPELEMLLNSIDLLKKEYIAKFNLAAKLIEKRKNVLKNNRQYQFSEMDKISSEKNTILQDYVSLVDKYEEVKESLNQMFLRMEKKIAYIQNQDPTLSDTELKLKENLQQEQEKIAGYKQSLEQVKQKHRYQELQTHRAAFSGNVTDIQCELATPVEIKNIKEILANQGKEITELVSLLKLLKSNS